MERRKSSTRPPAQQATRMKIVSVGNEGVGKSCLIKRYCEEKFVSKYISTIGVDFGVKPVKLSGVSVRINFFDFAGGPEYYDIRNEFYKDAQGGVIVYDVSARESFDALEGWLEEASRHGASDLVYVVVGNKADTKKSSRVSIGRAAESRPGGWAWRAVQRPDRLAHSWVLRRAVPEAEGKKWANARGLAFFETSAKDGDNVHAMRAARWQERFEALFAAVASNR